MTAGLPAPPVRVISEMAPPPPLSNGAGLRTLRVTTASSSSDAGEATGRRARRAAPDRAALLAELFGEHATPEHLSRLLLATPDVAALFEVSHRTVTEWARRGRLPAVRTPGGHHRFPAPAVRDLLVATRRVTPPKRPPPATPPSALDHEEG